MTSGERSSLETIDRREECATTPRLNPLRRRPDREHSEGIRYSIERGGPGREGFFSYGSLEGLRKANASHCSKGELRRRPTFKPKHDWQDGVWTRSNRTSSHEDM